ncbi:MAG: sugar transferase [Erysipelotrichia bacterium]|jgi:O-antigen biosynthesis protein WbqP|nr:sugar transferase [Erysipelotrichia bacterium]
MGQHSFTKRQKHYLRFKRSMDIILSGFAILFFLPLFIIVAILIKLTSKGPIFFIQERVGKNKKIFKIIKFRTMKVDAPEIPPNKLTKGEQRAMLTSIGYFLRKTSIDELPQIFNIFVGHMSIIGPRPPAAKNENDIILERDKYDPSPNNLRPGLTGHAQVSGRMHEVKQKAELDGFYAKNFSFKLDFKIFFSTVKKIFKFEGS